MKKYQLTNAQKRIWYAQKKYGTSPVFNIGGRVLIKGNANLNLLAQSFQVFIEQNDALRIRLYEEYSQVFQIVINTLEQIEIIDFSENANAMERCDEWCKKKLTESFSMIGSPLYFFCVFKLSESLTGYFVKFHHIIADGWSMELLTEQIVQNYECLLSGKEPKTTRPSYMDYVTHESTLSWEKESIYWQKNAELLSDMSISINNNLEARRKSFSLDFDLQKRLSDFIKQKRITWNVFFIGLLQIFQYKKTGQKVSSTGIPFLARSSKQEYMTFGTFTNTLPFCSCLNEKLTVSEHYMVLTKQLKETYENQYYPVNLLVQNIQAIKREGMLYHTCINYYNTTLTNKLCDFLLENSEFHRGCQEQPLQVIIRHWNRNKIQLDFDYQTGIYSDKQIQTMYEQWVLLIEQIIANPLKQISSLCLISDEDKQKLITSAINNTNKQPVSWIQCMNNWITNTPDEIAVSQGDKSWTYAQFYNEIEQLIIYYKASGIKKGDIVMTALPHEIKSIAAIYAIILCGAVYLPVSQEWPIERIKEIQQDCKARFLISESISLPNVYTLSMQYKINKNSTLTKFSIPDGEDNAYIIYTSGSTGKPKGVIIRHRSLNNYLQWAGNTYSIMQHDVYALFSAFTFDFTFTALFAPMMSGGEIRIYQSTSEQPNVFKNILCENRVTILKITPSHIGLIKSVEHHNDSIHTFIVGGEDLKTHSCETLLTKFNTVLRIYNEYGPTESTVGCIVYKYDPQKDRENTVPIGKPINGVQAFLFDKDGMLLPYDTKAELILGGEGLTCGYCNKSENSEKFIANDLLPGKILYRTGDLAYMNDQGIYVYCGRIDDELKIRGYRINPSELECKAMESKMVLEASAKTITIQGSTNLYLYIVSADCYQEKEFKDWLAQKLPGYMMPKGIIKLDAMPLTIHGKIDKSRLPEWKPYQCDISFIAQTKEEEVLFNIWNELLSDGVNINSDSNFYALGGDSIKGIQLSSRIIEYGYELKVVDILTNPIFSEMVKCITKAQEPLEDEKISEEPFKGLPIIQWFFNQGFENSEKYNHSVVLKLKHNVNVNCLEKVLNIMINHHDSLRINKTSESNQLFYNPVHLKHSVKITAINAKSHGWVNIESEIQDSICVEFNLEKDLLFRTYLIFANEEQYILFIFHHLIIDGVSWQIFLHDVSLLLDENKVSVKQCLPHKTVSYARFAHEYNERFNKSMLSTTVMNNDIGINVTQQRKIKYEDYIVVEKVLSSELTHNLMGPANITYNTKPNELIIAALALTIQHFTNNDQIEIDIESHGRDILPDIDVRRTIGWFTAINPVILTIDNSELKKQIIDLKEQLRRYETYKYIGINKLMPLNDKSKPKIRLNYMGDLVEINNHHWELIDYGWENNIASQNKSSYLIDINLLQLQGYLRMTIAFSQACSEQKDIIFSYLINTLEIIIKHCLQTKELVLTPSDFNMVDLRQDDINSIVQQL